MNKKKLIYTYVLQVLAVATLFIMVMPIIKASGSSMAVFETVLNVGDWVFMEEYLFGIAGLISVICLPLLVISLELNKLCASGVIKNKKLELVLYIVNIVLVALVVGVTVNYFLGLGRTIGMSGLKLFKGKTLFSYATAFFYLHTIFSIAMLVIAILNRNKKTK